MHASRSILIASAVTLALPGAALAQAPTPTPTATPTATPPVIVPTATPTVSPTPPAATGHLRISVKAPYRSRGHRVALRGDKLLVAGVLKPAIAGQRVLVRLTHGNKTVRKRAVRTGGDGHFTLKLGTGAAGTLTVRASHAASAAIKTVHATGVGLQAFSPALRFGSRGTLMRLFQKGLAAMKYPSPRTGVYDAATGRAVMAYRKVNSMPRSESPNAAIIRRVLAGRGSYHVKHPHAGHHVEADLSRQVLALVDGDRVVRIEPVSSGKPSTPTIQGTFHFYSKTPGTNSEGMVYSNYFIRGYAIHGYADVPDYNASHGCLRIPIPDAIRVYDWINLGDTIFVEI
jgi:hypothetical protein